MFDKPFRYTFDGHTFNENSLASMCTVKMVKMDKDSNNRKRKKTNDDNARNLKKFQWTRNGSGSEEEDEDLFSWEEYLQKCHAKAAPKETFKHVQDTKIQGFVAGMKLECLDRSSLDTDTYWVATVVMASGPLLLLRYDGYDDDRSGDFWCDAASEELQPIGWSAKTNNILIPPAAIRHKESNWAKFLMQDLKDAVFAPEHLFHKRSDSGEENQLKAGLKLELVNKDEPVNYWVASVVDAYGLRLRLRHEGSEDETHDVWVYFLSEYVQQLGWGSKHDLTLKVPSGLKARHPDKNWSQLTENLLMLCQSSTEDVSLNQSLHKTSCLPSPHGFESGMKLEAVNPRDPSSICAATVSKVANATFFQVQIDSLISCGDERRPSMWCNSNSRNIFPVGWCEKNSIQLTPPPGYLVHPFWWETYLEWTNATPAPESLFTQDDPPHNFEIGMKLEAVDQTNPSTMTVATVTQVVGRTLWVLLDGYKHDSLEHIYDVESYNLFPVGWCSMNGHPLLTPRVQRPQEENRRLSSLRTRQRENKKTTVTSDTTNTSNTVNHSKTTTVSTTQASSTAKVTNTMSTTNQTETTRTASSCSATVMDERNTTSTKTLTNTTSTSSSNQSSSADVDMSDTHEVTKETTPSEGAKKEEKLEGKGKAVKGPYGLRPSTLVPRDYVAQLEPSEDEVSQEKHNVEAVIDLTGEEDDDTDKAAKPAPTQIPVSSKLTPKNDSGICIYVKKTCEPGPFLKQSRLAGIPPVIGPAGANIVLRQLVEQIVLSAHSSKQVLKLLASETDKMTIASILKTLRTKLSLCENLISLHRVSLCSQCDVSKPLPRSPSQHTPKNSALQNASGFQQNRVVTGPCQNIGTTARPKTVVAVADRIAEKVASIMNRSPRNVPDTVVLPANSKPVSCFDRASSQKTNERVIHSSASAPAPPSSNESKMDSDSVVPENNVRLQVGQVKGGPVKPSLNSSSQTRKHITQWNVGEVVDFIRNTDCHKFAEEFQKQEIDGRALTLLSLDEIHKCLGVTLGPAIKLHFSVQKLRRMRR